MATSSSALAAAQARYKRNFDARVRNINVDYNKGDLVFVKREASTLGDTEHKLRTKVVTGQIISVNKQKRFAIVQLQHGPSTVSFDRMYPVPKTHSLNNVPTRNLTKRHTGVSCQLCNHSLPYNHVHHVVLLVLIVTRLRT